MRKTFAFACVLALALTLPLGAAAVTGNGTVSFAIRSSGTDSAIYSTKEAGTNLPQLVITYGP